MRYWSYLAAILAVFFWSGCPVLIKSTLTYGTIADVLLVRFIIGALLFSPCLLSLWRKINKFSFWELVSLSLVVAGLIFIQTYTISITSAAVYVCVMSLNPICFIIWQKYKLNNLTWIGILASFIGVVGYSALMKDDQSLNVLQVLLLISSMLIWVVYSIKVKKYQDRLTSFEMVAMTSYISFFATFCFWQLYGTYAIFETDTIIYSSLPGILMPLAMVLFIYSLREQPVFATFSQYLEPVFGVLIAILLLHEYVTYTQATCCLIIVVGNAIIGRQSLKEAQHTA